MSSKAFGNLFLIPSPLGEGMVQTLPTETIEVLHQLRFLIAEKAKTARHFIKATNPPFSLQELDIKELNKRTNPSDISGFLRPLKEGKDMGLLSEAGCPGVADPGAEVVRIAHENGIEVIPLVGPSSLLLALMVSGMNGQSFCFHGYLPVKKPMLAKELKKLEQLSRRLNQTQLFIEAPYRNNQVMTTALEVLSPNTLVGIATDLTTPEQLTKTFAIKRWKREGIPDLHKRPTVFTLLSK